MQTMQSNFQDSMLDMVTSLNFISQIQHSFYLNQVDPSSSLDLVHSVPSQEPNMVDLSTNLYSPTSSLMTTNKLEINDFSMQNLYDIPPSFTVVPPNHQALEDTTIFDISSLAEEQEMNLQKNLVKDVFFSPAMMDSIENPSLLTTYFSLGNNDDCHSVVSDTTSSSSLSYQHAKDDDDDEIEDFSSDSQDQVLFLYGLDLAEPTTSSAIENRSNKKIKLGGLGTRATSSKKATKIKTSCSRGTKHHQQVDLANSTYDVDNRQSSSTMSITKKRKTCNKDVSKSMSNTKEKPSKQTRRKSTHSENTSVNSSDAISSTWEYKRSDNKNDISTKENSSTEAVDKFASMSLLPDNKPRSICSPSIYQKLSKQNIDWCRYCGTTEGVNWRPGPWGKRTLCNKHGCDYKGYGFACKLPRLDLTSFASETIDKRDRPVLQSFCSHCQREESWKENQLVLCEGCPKAFHQECFCDGKVLTNDFIKSDTAWYCSEDCQDNLKRKRVVVELPRKRLPLMRTFKNGTVVTTDTTKTPPRSSSREH